jgi:hypothetical protein
MTSQCRVEIRRARRIACAELSSRDKTSIGQHYISLLANLRIPRNAPTLSYINIPNVHSRYEARRERCFSVRNHQRKSRVTSRSSREGKCWNICHNHRVIAHRHYRLQAVLKREEPEKEGNWVSEHKGAISVIACIAVACVIGAVGYFFWKRREQKKLDDTQNPEKWKDPKDPPSPTS